MMQFANRVPGLVKKAINNPSRVYRSIIFKTCGVFFRDRLLTPRLERSSAKMLVTPRDPGLSQQLYVWGWREEVETEMVKGYLTEGQVVVDIGANIGFYVLLEGELIGPKGRIIAIEPSAANVELLKRNVALNKFEDRVEVVHGAISSETGKGTLYLTKHFNLNSMNPGKLEKFTDVIGTTEVPTYRLDDLLTEWGRGISDVNFIRMDVEGHEVAVVRGMSQLLQAATQLGVLMEVHPELIKERFGEEGYQEMLTILEENGMVPEAIAVNISCRESVLKRGMTYDDLRKTDDVYNLFLTKKQAA